MDSAKSTAASLDLPFGIFFCSEEMAKYAGEGTKGKTEYLKSGSCRKPPLQTCFDYASVVKALADQKIPVSKVAINKDSEALWQKYRVQADPTFVLCSADGQAITQLTGPQCTAANMTALLKALPHQYRLWKQRNSQKKADGEAPAR